MAYRIQMRRDTTLNWTDIDPILAQGEFGYDLDLKIIKIGDGVTTWTNLSEISGGSGSGIQKVADEAARLALTPAHGDLVYQLDNDNIYAYSLTEWFSILTTSSGYEKVNEYGDLPAAGEHNDEIYVVLSGTGTYPVEFNPPGFYYCDGADWIYLSEYPQILKSANFGIVDSTDETKQLKLDLSGITTGTTRTLVIPDINDTIATLGDIPTDLEYINSEWNLPASTMRNALNELTSLAETVSGTGRVTPIDVLTITGANEITVNAGNGYINYQNFHKFIEWSETTIDTSGYSVPGSYYVYVTSGEVVSVANSIPNQYQNVILGFFYWTGSMVGMSQDYSHVLDSGTTRFLDYISRMGSFIYDNGGQIQESGLLKIISTACKAQYGSMDVALTQVGSLNAGTRFFIWFLTANYGWFPDYWSLGMNEGKVPTLDYNDVTKSIIPASVDGTFVNLSDEVVFPGDLTSELVVRNRLLLATDDWMYMTPISSMSYSVGDDLTTVTLATPYYGAGGTAPTYVFAPIEEVPTDKWVKHLILRTLDDNLHLVMGQAYYDTYDEADAAGSPTIPTAIENSNMKMAYAIVCTTTTSLATDQSLKDIRPLPFTHAIGGTQGAGEIKSHSALDNLGNDDHLQYARTDGTRDLTGIQAYASHPTFTTDEDMVDKKYVTDRVQYGTTDPGSASGLEDGVLYFKYEA